MEAKIDHTLEVYALGLITRTECLERIMEFIKETRRYVSDLYTSFGYPVLGELEEKVRQRENE